MAAVVKRSAVSCWLWGLCGGLLGGAVAGLWGGDAANAQPNAVAPEPAALQTAQLPELPEELPKGYVIEAKDRVRWIYPTSATDEVAELQQAQPDIWNKVTQELGQEVAADLDIRVAIEPTDMRRLAGGRPLPAYATGVALPHQGLILLSLTAPQTWMRPNMVQLLTHELSHVALYRAVAGGRVPRWFSEGVAIHQAGERSLARIRTLWMGALAGKLMRADQLSGAFPKDHHEVALAYAQSADLVRYLLEGTDDRKRFGDLISKLRDGETFTDAVASAYHVDLGYIEREWRNEITGRYGRWPSALAGLTGIWSIGALLLVVGFVRTRRQHHRTLAQWQAAEAEAAARLTRQRRAHAEASRTPATGTNRVDEVFDRLADSRRNPAEIPTIEHEGRNYTLH